MFWAKQFSNLKSNKKDMAKSVKENNIFFNFKKHIYFFLKKTYKLYLKKIMYLKQKKIKINKIKIVKKTGLIYPLIQQ